VTFKAETVLQFIKDYKNERGIAPTYREIGQGCDIRSTSVVRYYLDYLERKGYIKRLDGVARGIVLCEDGLSTNGG
jgi:repressor LexA